MRTLFINGKFTVQRMTGVQRVAHELTLALDRLLLDSSLHCVLLCPPVPAAQRSPAAGAPRAQAVLPLQHIKQRSVGLQGMPLHAWEQLVLPWHARKGLLLNLAGTAPYMARGQAAIVHDAAVFDHPEAYTDSFVRWYRCLFQRLGRRAESLMTVSGFSRQRLAASLNLDPSQLGLVQPASDHFRAIRPELGIVKVLGLVGRPFLLAVGSDNPTKNLQRLLQAHAAVPHAERVPLVLVGGRNDRVFARSAESGDTPGVLFTGTLDDAALKALYLHATALVFPSVYEGCGLPPLEAMACGCPVAAAEAASIPEVCGDAALYFDPHSVPDITRALRRIGDDADLRLRLSLRGAELVGKHSWAEAAAQLQGHLLAHLQARAQLKPSQPAGSRGGV